MARIDKQTPSKMAGYHTGNNPHQPPNHPPPQYHPSAAPYTQPAATAATPPTAQQENHARVRSYDSFKRIIEGPTYHPSHSRESSQASTGSGENRSPRKSGHSHTGSRESGHSHTGSRGSAHSLTPGRTIPQYSSTPGAAAPQDSNSDTFRHVPGGHSHQGHIEYGQQPGGSRQGQNPGYNNNSRYQRTQQGGHPRTEPIPPQSPTHQANRVTYPSSHQPRTGTRFFNEDESAGRFEGDLPSVHHQMRRGAVERSHPPPPPPPSSGRVDQGYPPSYHHHLRHHPRPEPDGEDSSSSTAHHPTHDPPPYHSHHHPQHQYTRVPDHPREVSPPRTTRPKLQRQHGVHVTEEAPVVHRPEVHKQPRPKTEYLDRSGVYEEPPVRMRDRTGRDGVGYVNSAFIEEISPDLGLSHDNMAASSSSLDDVITHQRQQHNPEQREYSQAIRNAQNYSRPSSHLPMGSEGQGYNSSSVSVKVQVEGPLHKEPMKRTVGEAMRDKEDQVQMRRQYVQHKHRSNTGRQHTENTDRFRFSQIESSSQSRPYVRVSNPAQSQVHNSGVYPTPSVPYRSSQPLHRPLSVSPDRKRQRRFNSGDIQHGGVQPEVGLQSFVHRDTDSKSPGAAIMVHMVPPSEKQRNNSGTTSPVIINVGEMTWERLKRQVSKKNVYVVQQKEEVKVTTRSRSPSKPRTHFTLSLFTMCFCLSPLGFIAMIFAVCSASAYKDKQPDSGRCLSKVALVLSIVGIVGSLATVAILIWTNTLPMIGRYSEPEGN